MEISKTLSVISFMITVVIRITISKTTTATEIFGETDGCPVNSTWTPESHNCYLHVKDDVNFSQANERCKELGAHLVFIDSEIENKFIQDFAGNLPIWIGLYRPTNEICAGSSCGNWIWLDGSVPQYSKWADGLSENSNQCAFMDSLGDWDHSRTCYVVRTYVCEQQRTLPRTMQEPSTMRSTSDIIHPSSSDAVATMDSPVANDVATMDSPSANDDAITYIGVGVSTAIIAISVFVGLCVCYMKTRRRENRDPQANNRISNKVYENCGHGAPSNPTKDQCPTNRKAVHFNTLSGKVDDVYTSTGAEYKEDNSAYEELKNYSDVNPDYTRLQVPQSADTQHGTNAFYSNVVHH